MSRRSRSPGKRGLTYATLIATTAPAATGFLVNAMPEAFYLAGLRVANSRSAMVLALALVFSLVLAAALALYGDRAASAHGKRDTDDSAGRPERTGAGQQTGGAG